jgi:cell division protein FtsN
MLPTQYPLAVKPFKAHLKAQFGGTFIGIILGVVLGLGVALGVAVYVTKVPVPFLNKAPSRSAEQDAEEAKKNKDWDPNAPLYGRNPVRPASGASSAVAAVNVGAASAAASQAKPGRGAASAAVAVAAPSAKPAAIAVPSGAPSADPLGDLAREKSGPSAARPSADGGLDPFTYYVQVGAFRTPEDAEAQRAKLSLLGVEAKVSEREQSGRTVYRVRVGPFEKKGDADNAKAKLEAAAMETALVRTQR